MYVGEGADVIDVKVTEKGDWQTDDSLGRVLDLDGGHVVNLAAKGTPEDGQVPVAHRDAVLPDDPRCERDRAGRILVVGDLGWHGLSVGA